MHINDKCDELCTSNRSPLLDIKGLQFLVVLQVPELLAQSEEGKCVALTIDFPWQ